METIKRIIRGCGYTKNYGHHPGTGFLLIFVLAGLCVGFLEGGVFHGVFGAGVMLLFFGPMYLYGAYGRGDPK